MTSCVGGLSIGTCVGDLDALLQVDDEDGVGEVECLKSSECRAAKFLFSLQNQCFLQVHKALPLHQLV